MAGLTWVSLYPDDVATLVAHEPPSTWVLPATPRRRTGPSAACGSAYQDKGFGAGMATFIGVTMWPGEFTDDYFAQPAPDPAMFGMPTEDDGKRDDPLLSERSRHGDAARVRPRRHQGRPPTRVVLAVGEETGDTITGRTSRAVAERLGSEVAVFPSHHGGFVGGGPENPYAGKPVEFGVRLHEVLGN